MVNKQEEETAERAQNRSENWWANITSQAFISGHIYHFIS